MKQHTASDIVFKSDLSTRARIVFMYLSYRSNKENTCFPSIKTIARECGMAVSTVKRALNDLDISGYIEKNPRFRDDNGQTSNLYILIEGKSNEDVTVQEEDILKEPMQYKVSVEIKEYIEKNQAFAASNEAEQTGNHEQPMSNTLRQMSERLNWPGHERGGVHINRIQAPFALEKPQSFPTVCRHDSSYPTGEPPPSSITQYRELE